MLAYSWGVHLRATPSWSAACVSVRTLQPSLTDERTHLLDVDSRGRNPQRSGQGPCTPRLLHALGSGVDMGSTSRPGPIRIHRTSAGGRWVGHDAHQGRSWFPSSTPDARSDGFAREANGQVYSPSGAGWSSPSPGPPVGAAAGPLSGRISIRQPVSRAASRAFCPSRPIAKDSW